MPPQPSLGCASYNLKEPATCTTTWAPGWEESHRHTDQLWEQPHCDWSHSQSPVSFLPSAKQEGGLRPRYNRAGSSSLLGLTSGEVRDAQILDQSIPAHTTGKMSKERSSDTHRRVSPHSITTTSQGNSDLQRGMQRSTDSRGKNITYQEKVGPGGM